MKFKAGDKVRHTYLGEQIFTFACYDTNPLYAFIDAEETKGLFFNSSHLILIVPRVTKAYYPDWF